MGSNPDGLNYDVQYTPGHYIGHADAMSRLRFKDDEDDLVAVGMATFEKPVIDAEKLRKEMQSNEFTKRVMNRIRTGIWKNCTKMEKYFINVSNALTVQNDMIYNGSRVFIPITCRKQVIEKFHDVHQGINALKNFVKKMRGGCLWTTISNNLSKTVQNAAKTDRDWLILLTNGKTALHGKDCIWTGFMKQTTVTFWSLLMLGPVGWKLSCAQTDQRGTWSDVSEQSFLGLEYHIRLCPITERSWYPNT